MRKAQPFTVEHFRLLGLNNRHAIRLAIQRMVIKGELESIGAST